MTCPTIMREEEELPDGRLRASNETNGRQCLNVLRDNPLKHKIDKIMNIFLFTIFKYKLLLAREMYQY